MSLLLTDIKLEIMSVGLQQFLAMVVNSINSIGQFPWFVTKLTLVFVFEYWNQNEDDNISAPNLNLEQLAM